MHEATTLAYLAGVIDSDGYITIQRTKKANKGKAAPNTYYSLQVGIAGTRTAPHELAVKVFGGAVQRYSNGKHRPQFQWRVQGTSARVVLESILPYLLVKKEQALKGLALQAILERDMRRPITPHMREERNVIWQSVVGLNQSRAGRLLDGVEHNGYPA